MMMATEDKVTTPGPTSNIVRCADCGASWCRVCCELWVPFGQGGPAGGDDVLAGALDRFRAHCHEAHGDGDRESDARRTYTRLFGAVRRRRRPGEALSRESVPELLADIEHDLVAHCGWKPGEVAVPGLADTYEVRASRASERCARCLEGPSYDIDSANELSSDRLARELAKERARLDPNVSSARTKTREPLGRTPREKTREEVQEETFVAIMRRIVELAERAREVRASDLVVAQGALLLARVASELSRVPPEPRSDNKDGPVLEPIARRQRCTVESIKAGRKELRTDVRLRHRCALDALTPFNEAYCLDAALSEAATLGSRRLAAEHCIDGKSGTPMPPIDGIPDPLMPDSAAEQVKLVRERTRGLQGFSCSDADILRQVRIYDAPRSPEGRPERGQVKLTARARAKAVVALLGRDERDETDVSSTRRILDSENARADDRVADHMGLPEDAAPRRDKRKRKGPTSKRGSG